MGELEQECSPVLKSMLLGQDVRLTIDDQVRIRAWLTLRAMIIERGGAARNAKYYYTSEERRDFSRSLEPPAGMYLWLFFFRSPRWVARSNVANIGLHPNPEEPLHQGQVMTGLVGALGFQILICRWLTDMRLVLNSPHILEWEPATTMLWPESADVLTWPPVGGYLADDTIEQFLDRWIHGIPLQPTNPTSS